MIQMKNLRASACLLSLCLLLAACRQERAATAQVERGRLHLRSEAFAPEGFIPSKYTCTGANLSPPLSWGVPPEGTQSFVLIVEKEGVRREAEEAPDDGTVLWMVFNIAPDVRRLTEGLQEEEQAASEGKQPMQGGNHQGTIGYTGPCPTVGDPGRYTFRLYALRAMLSPEAGRTKQHLLQAMNDYILAEGAFTGVYSY